MKKKLLILLIVSVLSEVKGLDYLKIDEIKKGDTGYGLTSFLGSEIDTFYVEIIDILNGVGTGEDIILARLSGDKIEKTGVIAGMSGSPVFIDGKIIGAVAYAWTFSKEPICGITPFENMLRMKDEGFNKNIIPIRNVLTLSGISRNEFIDSLAKKLSLEIVPGGISENDIEIKPGAPCGVVLAYGDAVMSVFGTLTFVKDSLVYAFGHPALLGGNVKMPFAMGVVNAILPSLYSSFKISSPTKITGAVIFDGKNGIVAKIGENADVIEFNISFKNQKKRYFMTNEDFLYRNILASLLFYNLMEYFGNSFKGSITARTEFYLTDNNTITYESFAYRNPSSSITFEIYDYLNYLNANNVSKIGVKRIDINIDGKEDIKEYLIKDLIVNKSEYKLGERIYIKILMERYRNSDVETYIEMDAPQTEGDYYIEARSLRDWYFENEKTPRKKDEIIKYLKNIPSYNILSIDILKEGDVIRDGKQIMNTTMKIILNENINKEKVIVSKKDVKMDGNVLGSKTFKIKVRR